MNKDIREQQAAAMQAIFVEGLSDLVGKRMTPDLRAEIERRIVARTAIMHQLVDFQIIED